MTVIKNQKSNTYEVRTYYKDWTGVRKQKTKRGFKRKCDAQEWERAFKLKENLSLDMYFEDFVDLYLNDIKSRIKYNTWLTKKHIARKQQALVQSGPWYSMNLNPEKQIWTLNPVI